MLAWTDSYRSALRLYRYKQISHCYKRDIITWYVKERFEHSEMLLPQLMTLSEGGIWVHHVLSIPHPMCVFLWVCGGQSDKQAGATSKTAARPIWLNPGPVPPHSRISMCWNTVASCCCATPAWLTALKLWRSWGGGGGVRWEAVAVSQLINSQMELKVQ